MEKTKMAEMAKKQMGIIDIITNFNIKLSIGQFLEISTRIVPRFYTIASSSVVNPKGVRLVAAIDYNKVNDVEKKGLSSLYFQEIQRRFARGEDCKMRVSYQNSNFRMPERANTPVKNTISIIH